MYVTASWCGEEVEVEVDEECRSLAALKRALRSALPKKVNLEKVCLEVCGRAMEEEDVVGLVEGSVVAVSPTPAARAAATLREEGRAVDAAGFRAAAEAGDLRLCELDLDAGVANPAGAATPLHIACCKANAAVCALLDARGCDGGRSVDDEKVLGLSEGSVVGISATPVALAAAALREEGLPVDFGGFCRAAEEGEVPQCRLYLEAVGVVWPPGVDTPLHFAVRRDRREVVALLLDADCDKDVKNNNGETPLHHAIGRKKTEVTKRLLDAGCDKEATDAAGNTPLHCAIQAQNMELTKLLLVAGCDKDAKNTRNLTPLHHAILRRNLEVIKLLLNANCDTGAKNNYGNTPLHCAVHTQNLELVKLLLDADCDKDAEDASGRTPLHLASFIPNKQLTKLLVNAGCAKDAQRQAARLADALAPGCCVRLPRAVHAPSPPRGWCELNGGRQVDASSPGCPIRQVRAMHADVSVTGSDGTPLRRAATSDLPNPRVSASLYNAAMDETLDVAKGGISKKSIDTSTLQAKYVAAADCMGGGQ